MHIRLTVWTGATSNPNAVDPEPIKEAATRFLSTLPGSGQRSVNVVDHTDGVKTVVIDIEAYPVNIAEGDGLGEVDVEVTAAARPEE